MKIGVIGGSGVYDLEGIDNLREEKVTTTFGDPSDSFMVGELGGNEVFFLPRHARGHKIMPSEINHRANICALKELGAELLISISAVGSLREELRPGDIVLPDQYFDRTKASGRHTFFGDGAVAHVSFGDPTCAGLSKFIAEQARSFVSDEWENKDVRIVDHGTYVNMEGPAFSTRAESNVYRGLGFDIIGMTSLAEARLCREAELCYQPICMVTDYDCWRVSEEAVTVDIIIKTLTENASLAKNLLAKIVPAMPADRGCGCSEALSCALITQPDDIDPEARERLKPIIGKYLPGK